MWSFSNYKPLLDAQRNLCAPGGVRAQRRVTWQAPVHARSLLQQLTTHNTRNGDYAAACALFALPQAQQHPPRALACASSHPASCACRTRHCTRRPATIRASMHSPPHTSVRHKTHNMMHARAGRGQGSRCYYYISSRGTPRTPLGQTAAGAGTRLVPSHVPARSIISTVHAVRSCRLIQVSALAPRTPRPPDTHTQGMPRGPALSRTHAHTSTRCR